MYIEENITEYEKDGIKYIYIGDIEDYITRGYFSYEYMNTNGFIRKSEYVRKHVTEISFCADSNAVVINGYTVIPLEVINEYSSFFRRSHYGLLNSLSRCMDRIAQLKSEMKNLEHEKSNIEDLIQNAKTLDELWELNDVENNK